MQANNLPHVANALHIRRPEDSGLNRVCAATRTPKPLGTLILDSNGMVRFCSDALARLAGSTAADMVGTAARSFMPDLPLDPATEGYNVAFAAFCAARRCLQSWTVKTGHGGTVQVEGYFGSLRTDAGYRFCLELQLPAEHGDSRDMTMQAARRSAPAMHGAGGAAAARTTNAEKPWPDLGHKSRTQHAGTRRPPRPRAAAISRLAGEAPAARTPHVQLLLDREYRIVFASSAIEDLLALDYEKIIGMHVSDVLPELLSRVGGARSVKSAIETLRSMGSFASHARHANGQHVPVVVALREKRCNHMIPLLISAAAD